MTCKFCGIKEGSTDRRGHAAHINRDNLCGACYYVLERIKYKPDKLSESDKQWFVDMCEQNRALGRFIPIKQRIKPKAIPWACAKCGTTDTVRQDLHYKKYCTACAEAVRRNRTMSAKANRKTRSDKHVPRGPKFI